MRKVEPTAQHACRKTTFEHKAGPQLPHAAGVTTGQPPPRTMAPLAGWPNRNTWTRRISAPAAAATAVDQMDAAQQQVLRQKCGDRGPGRSSAAHTLCPPTGGGKTHAPGPSGTHGAVENLAHSKLVKPPPLLEVVDPVFEHREPFDFVHESRFAPGYRIA